eukprot:14084293-Alexandrium_andersonii.AAC.1
MAGVFNEVHASLRGPAGSVVGARAQQRLAGSERDLHSAQCSFYGAIVCVGLRVLIPRAVTASTCIRQSR